MTPVAARTFLVKLIALHDIGKFAAPFQAKCPEHYPPCVSAWKGSTTVRHDEIGSAIRECLTLADTLAPSTWSRGDFEFVWHAITGHHGKPRVVDDAPTNPTEVPQPCRAEPGQGRR